MAVAGGFDSRHTDLTRENHRDDREDEKMNNNIISIFFGPSHFVPALYSLYPFRDRPLSCGGLLIRSTPPATVPVRFMYGYFFTIFFYYLYFFCK